jgi:hypothetical protein
VSAQQISRLEAVGLALAEVGDVSDAELTSGRSRRMADGPSLVVVGG